MGESVIVMNQLLHKRISGDVIRTTLRSNLPAQFPLCINNGTESRVILDEQGAGVLNGKMILILNQKVSWVEFSVRELKLRTVDDYKTERYKGKSR
jgi:DNA segregation ATPase FtsK/SpoIIIE-like protein